MPAGKDVQNDYMLWKFTVMKIVNQFRHCKDAAESNVATKLVLRQKLRTKETSLIEPHQSQLPQQLL